VALFKVPKKRLSKRGISPAISTVIMTGAMITILSVALVFANNLLWSRVAEGDFDSSRQLMQSVGLQIDDVAWTTGRTETITYATQYGDVVLQSSVITYNVTVVTSEGTSELSNTTGAIMFNLPTSRYSISDDYWERIYPSVDESLTLTGTSAPVARVFAIERTPMPDGKYIRVVTAPSIRVLNSSISTSTNSTYYIKMYLPVLSAGESPRLTQSITLTGESIKAYTFNNVQSISVSADFPRGTSDDFDSAFFNFPADSENFDFTLPEYDDFDNIVLELYVSEVSVAFGVS
jgi:hypothetical protein